MNLLRLKYFIALAEHLNFTEAAKHLYVTQPTLSRQIASLEDELGTQLFVRTKRTVYLTAAGEIMLIEAKKIVKQLETLTQKLDQFKTGFYGELIIGYFGIIEHRFLSDMFKSFSTKYPEIHISLIKCTISELTDLLLKGKIDLIFTVSTGLHTLPNIKWIKINENKLKCLVSSDHSLADRDSIKLNELANENFVMCDRSSSPFSVDALINLCYQKGFNPNIIHYEKAIQNILLLVAAGKGIALMSSIIQGPEIKHIRFLDIEDCDDDIELDLVLAWNQDNNNPAMSLFRNEVKEQYSNLSVQYPMYTSS